MNRWNPFHTVQYFLFHGIAWVGEKLWSIHKEQERQKKIKEQQRERELERQLQQWQS